MSDYVPPEVVAEILSRVPVESLLRLRSVCKQWLSLISSPKFISKHLSHSPTQTLLRYYSKPHSKEIYTYTTLFHQTTTNTRIPFPFHTKSHFYFRIVASCNGVLCLYDDLFGVYDTIILWNPSIKRALTLPPPRVTVNNYGPYMRALGFGYDSLTTDYKVVSVGYVFAADKGFRVPPKVEVYSVSLGKWRWVKANIESFITQRFWSQAVIDGTIHWNAYDRNRDAKPIPIRNLILTFDLGTEKFGKLALPNALVGVPPFTLLVTVLRGLLSVVIYDKDIQKFIMDSMRTCDIWVMNEYGNVGSWTRRYKVKLDSGISMVLGMKREGELVLSNGSGKVVSYNCENGKVTSTGIRSTKTSSFMGDYVESLVLLGKGEVVRGVEPEVDDGNVDEIVENEERSRKMIILTHLTASVFR